MFTRLTYANYGDCINKYHETFSSIVPKNWTEKIDIFLSKIDKKSYFGIKNSIQLMICIL